MRVALAHDYLVHARGGEQVLLALHRLYPEAPVHVVVHDLARMPAAFRDMDVRPSFVQRIPGAARHFRALLPLYPAAVRSFRIAPCDVVISSSSAAVKNLYPPPGAIHLCYCHTPIRALWQEYGQTMTRELRRPWARRLATPLLWRIREWDRRGSARVHRFIANSALTAARIKAFYGREATVIHPPVDVGRFAVGVGPGDYFLAAGQLAPYKRVDIAVEACTRLGAPLIVAGDGPELARLEALAGPGVRFVGRVGDAELARLYAGARALIFPGVEDFGIVPLEAMASGRPVVAFAGGGALETVVEGVTGVLVGAQTVPAFADALRQHERHRWDAARIRAHAERFGIERFQARIAALVEEVTASGPSLRA